MGRVGTVLSSNIRHVQYSIYYRWSLWFSIPLGCRASATFLIKPDFFFPLAFREGAREIKARSD